MTDKRGWIQKYVVKRTDERDGLGEKHSGCKYFVLDLNHDPFALDALEAYSATCAETQPLLARDIQHRLGLYRNLQKITLKADDE